MLTAIREIINPDVMIPYDQEKKMLSLKEDGADSKVYKLFITHIPDTTVAFTLDYQPGASQNRKFQQLSPYVNIANDKGVNKGCDLVVIWKTANGQHTALIFDLKSDKPRLEATQKQLDNSEQFLRYILNMASIHYGIDISNIEIVKTIATTCVRTIRKGATYRPNCQPSQYRNFHIKAVALKGNRTAYVSLSQLSD